MTHRRFTRLAIVVAAFTLLLPATASAADATQPYIYVVIAEEAEIESNNGNFVLTIEQDDIDHVLEISKDPFKLTRFISDRDIVRGWKPGGSDFSAGGPMKGTITSEDGALAEINIVSVARTADEMSYVFGLDAGTTLPATMLGEVDDVAIVSYCCGTGGDAEWIWSK